MNLRNLLKIEGYTFVESGGNASDIQVTAEILNADNFTLSQALQVAEQIRRTCAEMKIDDSAKSAPVSAGIRRITMSAIACHTDFGDIMKWECCIEFKSIETSGAYYGVSALIVAQRFIDSIS